MSKVWLSYLLFLFSLQVIMSKNCLAAPFCKALCSEKDKIGSLRWKTLEDHLKNWNGLDTFGYLYDTIDWSAGPDGNYLHSLCAVQIASSRRLIQAKARNEKSKFSK